MKMKSFRVQKFRSIVDSGTIDLQEDVTCFVGKNEAGKSALLEALYHFNPAYGDKWDIDDQYPVWLKVQDRRAGELRDTEVISITFELEEADIEAYAKKLGPGRRRQVANSHDHREVFRQTRLGSLQTRRFSGAKKLR